MVNENVIDYDKLTIDKEDNSVFYNDEVHKYWTKDTKQNCISVTTLIHQFGTFDPVFWSAYKTLESLVSEDEFKSIKPTLLDRKKFEKEYYQSFGIEDETFEEAKSLILKEWDRKRDESCVRGTAIHKKMEEGHLSGDTQELQYLKLGGSFKTNTTNKIKMGEQNVYPELLLSNISDDKKLRIAGQADLIIIDGKDVYILDYKTGKKMDTKSFFDKKLKRSSKMKYPLNNLDDCNFMHYSMQLSTYAWMIKQIDPSYNIKMLLLIHIDHDGNVVNYECDYLEAEVGRMLTFYKKQIENEEFNKSFEKRVF